MRASFFHFFAFERGAVTLLPDTTRDERNPTMDGSQPTHPPPAPSSGIKLKFKLGGLNVSSASTSAAPPPPAAASSSKSAASISSAASVHPPTPAPPAPAPTTTAAAAAAPVTGKRVSVPSSKRQAAQQYDDYEEPAPAPRSSKSSNKHHRGGGGGESTHVKTESSAGAAKSSRARASSAAANAQAQAQAASAAAEAEEQELLAAQQHSYAQPSSASAAAAVPQQTTAAAFGPTGGSSGTSLNVRLAPPRQPLGINGVDALLAQHGEQALLGAPDMQKYNGLKRKYLEMTEVRPLRLVSVPSHCTDTKLIAHRATRSQRRLCVEHSARSCAFEKRRTPCSTASSC